MKTAKKTAGVDDSLCSPHGERSALAQMFLAKAFNSLPYPFYVIDVNDYTIKVGNAALGDLGPVKPGTTCYALTHGRQSPCEGPEEVCPLAEVRKTGVTAVVEHRHVDAKGRRRYYEIHVVPIREDKGEITHVVEFCFEITLQKILERAQKDSETKFACLAEAAFEGVVLHENGVVVEVNSAMEGITGRRASELIGSRFDEIVARDHGNKDDDEAGADRVSEATIVRKDGTRLSVEIRGKSFSYRDKQVRVAAIRDISHRKRMEAQLEAQRRILMETLEKAPMAVAVLNGEGRLNYWNPSLEKLTGYPERDLKRFSYSDIVLQSETARFKKKLVALMDGTWRSCRFVSRLSAKSGGTCIVDVHACRISQGDGNDPQYVCFFRDISREKRTERKQRSLVLRLRRLYSDLDELGDLLDGHPDEEGEAEHEDYGMTPMDNTIIELILIGFRNKEIAAHLDVAEITVKKHASGIYREFGVRTRVELAEKLKARNAMDVRDRQSGPSP